MRWSTTAAVLHLAAACHGGEVVPDARPLCAAGHVAASCAIPLPSLRLFVLLLTAATSDAARAEHRRAHHSAEGRTHTRDTGACEEEESFTRRTERGTGKEGQTPLCTLAGVHQSNGDIALTIPPFCICVTHVQNRSSCGLCPVSSFRSCSSMSGHVRMGERGRCRRALDACASCVCASCLGGMFTGLFESVRSTVPKTTREAKRCGICSSIMLLIGIALIIQAIVVPVYLHKALVTGLQDAVVLNNPTAKEFKNWADNKDNPLRLAVYVYNITNAEAVVDGATPVIVELGPYVYKQYQINYNTTFAREDGTPTTGQTDEDKHTLFFRSYISYEFDRDASVGDAFTTQVTTVNMPFVSFRALAFISDPVNAAATLNYLFTQHGSYIGSTEAQRLFTVKSVNQVLFGWEDDAMAMIGSSYNGLLKNYPSFEAAVADTMDVNQWNQIYTGVGTTKNQNRNYLQWHNASYIATCEAPTPTDYCDVSKYVPGWGNNTSEFPVVNPKSKPARHVSDLRGNDGSVFPAPVTDRSYLTMFYSPMLRSVDLEYVRPSSYKGVSLLDFGLPDYFWSSSSEYGPNKAYFQDGPSGLLNMTYMQGGIPLFVSRPRFAGGDKALVDAFDFTFAKEPAVIPHLVYSVEPESGVTFYVRTVSQVNLFADPLPGMPVDAKNSTVWFEHMKPAYFPVMWAQQEGGIGNDDAQIITDVITVMSVSKNAGIACGVILTVIGMIYLFLTWRTYDIEKQKHIHAVHSLIAASQEEGFAAGVGAGSTAGAGNSSLLDPSALSMKVGSPVSSRAHPDYASGAMSPPLDYGVPRKAQLADVDITIHRDEQLDPPSQLGRRGEYDGATVAAGANEERAPLSPRNQSAAGDQSHYQQARD